MWRTNSRRIALPVALTVSGISADPMHPDIFLPDKDALLRSEYKPKKVDHFGDAEARVGLPSHVPADSHPVIYPNDRVCSLVE